MLARLSRWASSGAWCGSAGPTGGRRSGIVAACSVGERRHDGGNIAARVWLLRAVAAGPGGLLEPAGAPQGRVSTDG
jgi:hypothetical protein